MPRTHSPYRKLPGKYSLLYTTRTLWLASDHLLSVEASLATEWYKRFYFKDIQALVVRRTHTGKIGNILLGLAALVPGAWAGFAAADDLLPGTLAGGAFAAFFLLILFVNVAWGPTCATYVQTAVQVERLHSLGRVRRACRVLDRLRPLIEEVQGPLSPPSQFVMGPGASGAPHAGATAGQPLAQAFSAPVSVSWHRALFTLLSLAGASFSLLAILDMHAAAPFGVLCILGAIVAVIGAIARQVGAPLSSTLKTVTWICLCLLLAEAFRGYAFYIAAAVWNHQHAFNLWELLQAMIRMYTADHPAVAALNLTMALGGLCLGAVGLLFSRNPR